MATLTFLLAFLLCVLNAGLWTIYAHLPMASAGWMLAAAGCVKLQQWSRMW